MTEHMFGPQYREVNALVQRAKDLTSEEVDKLRDAWLKVSYVFGRTAWDAARPPVKDPDRYMQWNHVWFALHAVASQIKSYESWFAVCHAGIGLCMRDRIEKWSYDALTGPWRRIIGELHPDDDPIPAEVQA